jgi:adenylate cyclase
VLEKTGECWWEAELYRLKGELTLKKSGIPGDPYAEANTEAATEAEGCFRNAIEISRRQGAKSLELRAVMSLAQLWRQQRKREEGRQLLSSVYGWFTEGLDTKDLQEARALLEALVPAA